MDITVLAMVGTNKAKSIQPNYRRVQTSQSILMPLICDFNNNASNNSILVSFVHIRRPNVWLSLLPHLWFSDRLCRLCLISRWICHHNARIIMPIMFMCSRNVDGNIVFYIIISGFWVSSFMHGSCFIIGTFTFGWSCSRYVRVCCLLRCLWLCS